MMNKNLVNVMCGVAGLVIGAGIGYAVGKLEPQELVDDLDNASVDDFGDDYFDDDEPEEKTEEEEHGEESAEDGFDNSNEVSPSPEAEEPETPSI